MNTFKTFAEAAAVACTVENTNPAWQFSNCDTRTSVIKYGPKDYGVITRDAYNLTLQRESLEKMGFVVLEVPEHQRSSTGPVWYAKR